MSKMVRLQVAIPGPTAEPRGSKLAVAAVIAVRNAMGKFWRWLNPEAETASAGKDAQRVREMALQYRAGDPAIAADLLAAADRHEALHEGR